jgi:adenylate cyclase
MTSKLRQPHDRPVQLSSALSWLVDAAGETPGADRLLGELGVRLVADGLPLAGGALTLAVPHPLIARRTWLWRAESGEVSEALGFVAGGLAAVGAAMPPGDAGRRWLAGWAAGLVHEDAVGSSPDGPSLGWIGRVRSRPVRWMSCTRPRASPRRRSPLWLRAPR